MKLIKIAFYTGLAFCGVSAAHAQYGLYGSPEVLQMPRQAATYQYGVPAGYPATANPAAEQLPGPTYYQPPAAAYQSYQPQPQYRAAASYQYQYPNQYQHQYSNQYRYPRPYPAQYPQPDYRRPARLDVARGPGGLQPIPAPPAAPAPPAPRPVRSYAAPPVQAPMPQAPVEQNYPAQDYPAYEQYRSADGYCGQESCEQYGGYCGYDDYCGAGYYSPWYASVSALVLGRSHGRRLWTSYVDGDLTTQLANTQFDMSWKWGGEVRFGRRFCCCCVPYALEAVYWTTEAFSGHQYTINPDGYVSTPLDLSYLFFGDDPASDWFNGAEEHRLWRRNEFHNLEVNLVREQLAWGCDSPWDIGWSLGVRYFRFEEQLVFGSRHQDCQWGQIGAEAYFNERITNNLVGLQFGFDAAYNVFNGVRVFITPKVGLYNNYIDHNFQAYVNDGRRGYGPYGGFPVRSNVNCISFLTQIDAGVDWQFSQHWGARLGYRVVAVSGAGLADSQFPQYMCDTPEIADIQHSDSLVLHGVFCGVTFNY